MATKPKEDVIIFKTQNEIIPNLKEELTILAKQDNRTLSGLIKKILIDFVINSKS
jgi:hypothetical protein